MQILNPVLARNDQSAEVHSRCGDVQSNSRETDIADADVQLCPVVTGGQQQFDRTGRGGRTADRDGSHVCTAKWLLTWVGLSSFLCDLFFRTGLLVLALVWLQRFLGCHIFGWVVEFKDGQKMFGEKAKSRREVVGFVISWLLLVQMFCSVRKICPEKSGHLL